MVRSAWCIEGDPAIKRGCAGASGRRTRFLTKFPRPDFSGLGSTGKEAADLVGVVGRILNRGWTEAACVICTEELVRSRQGLDRGFEAFEPSLDGGGTEILLHSLFYAYGS